MPTRTIVAEYSLASFNGMARGIGVAEGKRVAMKEVIQLRRAARRSKFERRLRDTRDIGDLTIVVTDASIILVQPVFTFGIKNFEAIVIRSVSRIVTAIFFAAALRQIGTAVEGLRRSGFVLQPSDRIFTDASSISNYVAGQIRGQI